MAFEFKHSWGDIDSLRYLQASLMRVDGLIREAVRRAQEAGHDPTDSLRGLIISDGEINTQLSRSALDGLWQPEDFTLTLPDIFPDTDPDLPFLSLAHIFTLSKLDCYILLLTLAPELDRRYERLYAYLQDDVSQRHPTVNLMMNMLGDSITRRFAVWERLQPENPLRKHHLVECAPDPNRYNPSFLAYRLKVDHRIVTYLLGDTLPDQRIQEAISLGDTDPSIPVTESLLTPLREAILESPMVYMQGAEGMGQREAAAFLCTQYALPLVVAKISQLIKAPIPFDLSWHLALREAYLVRGALLLEGWEHCLDSETHQPDESLWAALLAYNRPVFLCGTEEWEPLDLHRSRRMLRVQFDIPAYPERLETWEQFMQREQVEVDAETIAALAGRFRFTHHQIARAVHTAVDIARSRAAQPTPSDLYAGAQAHAGIRLGRLAKRIVPRYTWDDLILPPDQLSQLSEMTAWARFAHIVQDNWGFGKKIAHSKGISALFAGESGTGKTLAAEVIARDLGLILYKIDLSAVVSKYIGETEKNLSVIFTEARSSNAILFFDEADALFGKRSEVKDARDRYANIEVAYLLQEIELYDGIAIMATNLRQNLDEAFTRRLDFLVDFPFPESEYRKRIWLAHFPPDAPVSPDIDIDDLAERYHLAGGNIRNVVIGAAYLAASDGKRITPSHIQRAIRREHQKMGRLLDEAY